MASRTTRRVHLHGVPLVLACAASVFMAGARTALADPGAAARDQQGQDEPRAVAQDHPSGQASTPAGTALLRAQRAVVPVVVHDRAGAVIASGPGFFIDIGRLVVARSLIEGGHDVGVAVGGKERPVTAVLAEDQGGNVVLVGVDLPDGAPPALRAPSRASTVNEMGRALCAEGMSNEIVVEPARAVPGLGLVQHIESDDVIASGSAVVNARGELLGAAVSAETGPSRRVTFVVPTAQLLAMRRVGPVSLPEWSSRARPGRPAAVEAASLRGSEAAMAGRLDDAAAAFDAAATLTPSDADAWIALAECHRAQHDREASIAVWRRAVAAQPSNARFHHELALDLSDAGRHEQAAGEFAEVARLRPRDAEAQFNLGVAFAQVNRYEEEYKAYQAALAIDPAHVRALRNLGVTCLTLKRNDEAVTSFSRAGRLAPADPEIQTGLGLSYLSLRRFREAIDVLRHTLQIAPAFAKAHFGLGAAYFGVGDQAGARTECQTLRAIDKQKGDALCRIVNEK